MLGRVFQLSVLFRENSSRIATTRLPVSAPEATVEQWALWVGKGPAVLAMAGCLQHPRGSRNGLDAGCGFAASLGCRSTFKLGRA